MVVVTTEDGAQNPNQENCFCIHSISICKTKDSLIDNLEAECNQREIFLAYYISQKLKTTETFPTDPDHRDSQNKRCGMQCLPVSPKSLIFIKAAPSKFPSLLPLTPVTANHTIIK